VFDAFNERLKIEYKKEKKSCEVCKSSKLLNESIIASVAVETTKRFKLDDLATSISE